MSILFQRTAGPNRINMVQINQSVLGFPVPVVLGRGKIQQSLLWTDGFESTSFNTAGMKGMGGGKAGNQYDYTADLMAALCDGGPYGILGIGDVWSGQSWLENQNVAEPYTITGPTPTYTPVNASPMTGDLGVSKSVAVSGTYNDLATASPTVISVDVTVPLQSVPYVAGQTLATGTYSVSPTNVYNFSPADTGVTVQVNYTFALRNIKQTQIALIPTGKNIPISGDIPFSTDDGVVYYDTDVDNPLNGVALARVTGTPATGQYSVDSGSYTVTGTPGSYVVVVNRAASYTFAAGDINQEVMLSYQLDNSSQLPAGTQTSLAFELIPGTPTDPVAALLLTTYPANALGYPRIAKVLYTPMDLGLGAQVQQNLFEVLTRDMWGAGNADCSPVQCIGRVLTDQVWGLGGGPIPFPASAIDNGTGGTWGIPTPAGVVLTGATASNWFAANNFFISPVIDKQDSAASLIGKWLEAGMCAAFMSESLMKLVPYGDTSVAAWGAVWTAPSTFDAELDDTCFITKSGGDPVKISSSSWMEAYNTVQISWSNRANQYAPEVTPASDIAAIQRYGQRIESPQGWDFITTLDAAQFAGSMRVKRAVYTRNTYSFKLPFRFGHLEPMGIVSITTNSAWNAEANNTIQLTQVPARITRIVDNPDGTYDVTAEDLITGAHTPDGFNTSTAAPAPSPNQFSDPGNTLPVIVDAPYSLTEYSGGNELWIGAAGQTYDWGGCNVFASTDGDNYQQIGTVQDGGRLGQINTAFPAGSDPDTTDALVVNLEPGCGALLAGTTTDADNAVTLCWLDGEFISYSACTISGAEQYTMNTYIRRGQYGTVAGSHAANATFLRLDDALFKYAYANSWIGKPIYFKFQSFNTYGNSIQDLSACTAYTHTPSGTLYPAPPIVTVSQATTTTGSGGATSSNGLVVNGNGLSAVSTIYVTVDWTWLANYPTPSSYNVVLFEGTDPTNTSTYLVPIANVGSAARTYTFAIQPSSSMTDVNAAVEAVYA